MARRFSKPRREALTRAGGWLAAAAVGGAGLLRGRPAAAQDELPHLSEDADMAEALMYVHDATTSQSTMRGENEFCYNCQHFMGTQQTTWAACQIFPGKAVNADGWCNVWLEQQE